MPSLANTLLRFNRFVIGIAPTVVAVVALIFVSGLAAVAIPAVYSSTTNSTNATTQEEETIKLYEDGTGLIIANNNGTERAQFNWNVTSNHTVIFNDDEILLVEEPEGTEQA